ncbi:MAG: hypothetical protein ACI87N_003714 [Flavobacteriales bacterium]|jgi:hypothetical protein
MKKIHVLLIVLLGVFLMPTSTFACGDHSGKNSCSKEMSSKAGMKDCCSKDSNSKSKKHNGCNGKCGHAMCSAPSLHIGIVHSNPIENDDDVFNFSTKKPKFYQSVSFTSAGYSSIWLIPKIG